MSEILVLVDHVDGAVRKPTYELLTIARRLGEPSAVFIGPADQGAAVAEKVGKYGGRQAGTAGMFAGAGRLDELTEAFKALQRRAESGAVLDFMETLHEPPVG